MSRASAFVVEGKLGSVSVLTFVSFFFFSSRRRHTRCLSDWSSDVCSSDLFSRRALVYPACDTDRSRGPHRGRLYCSWMDLTAGGVTDIFLSFSDDRGSSWSRSEERRVGKERRSRWWQCRSENRRMG